MGKRLSNQESCPAFTFQKLISGKYKIRIIWNLGQGPSRYSEIRRGLVTNPQDTGQIAARVLSRELKQLCEFGLLKRKDFQTVPPKVEYSLTPMGKSFLPVIRAMHEWGAKHL